MLAGSSTTTARCSTYWDTTRTSTPIRAIPACCGRSEAYKNKELQKRFEPLAQDLAETKSKRDISRVCAQLIGVHRRSSAAMSLFDFGFCLLIRYLRSLAVAWFIQFEVGAWAFEPVIFQYPSGLPENEKVTILLLPGMDGTGILFNEFVRRLPDGVDP